MLMCFVCLFDFVSWCVCVCVVFCFFLFVFFWGEGGGWGWGRGCRNLGVNIPLPIAQNSIICMDHSSKNKQKIGNIVLK